MIHLLIEGLTNEKLRGVCIMVGVSYLAIILSLMIGALEIRSITAVVSAVVLSSALLDLVYVGLNKLVDKYTS